MGILLAGCLVACSSQTATGPRNEDRTSPVRSSATDPSFVAFEPGRHDRLLVVDAATGHVQRSTEGPGSEGYAIDLKSHVALLPVVLSSCRLAIERVPLSTSSREGVKRRVGIVRGGPVDDVEAQPALSPSGKKLAVIVASPPSVNSGMGSDCGDTDRVAVVSLPAGTVRYVTSQAGDQLDDLAWAGSRLLVRVTSPTRPARGRVVEIGSETDSVVASPTVLIERRGRPGPVFRWGAGLAVVDSGGLHRVARGRIAAKALAGTVGLPTLVVRVSVAADGRDLLLQTNAGDLYWWNGDSTRQIPVTVPGHWDEPVW